jgi:hypothetical protein
MLLTPVRFCKNNRHARKFPMDARSTKAGALSFLRHMIDPAE